MGWAGFAAGTLVNGGRHPNQDAFSPFSRWVRKPGVDFFEVDGATAREESLKGCADDKNKVDVLWSSIESWAAEFPEYQHAGIKAVAVAQVASSSNACAVVWDDSIRDLDDVQHYNGKIVTAKWSPAHWLALQIGPNVDSIDAADSFEIAKDQFVKGNFRAAALCEPYLGEALQQRRAHILPEKIAAINFILIARQDIAQESPRVFKDFIAHWLDGNTMAPSIPDKAIQSLFGSFENRNLSSLNDELQHIKLFDLDANDNLLRKNRADLFDRQFQEASRIWQQRGHIYATGKAEEARDGQFLPERTAQMNSGEKIR